MVLARPPRRDGGSRMRLCRFLLDNLVLTGFYADDHVIPIDQASEAYSEAKSLDFFLPETEDLLDLLPPEGEAFPAACELAAWVDTLDAETLGELALPIGAVKLPT